MLDRLDQPPAALFIDALAERMVERFVEVEEPLKIFFSRGSPLRLQQALQSAQDLGAATSGGFAHHGDLERFADKARLEHFVQADRGYEAAALRQDLYEAVFGELDQRLAHRGAANAELKRELGFGDFLSRSQAHRDDRAAEDFVALRVFRT